MNIIWSEKINQIQILLGLKNHPNTNIKKNHPNTNMNIIRFEKITRIRIRILFGLKNHPNTNTNIIRGEKITRIRTRILFGLNKSPEYEYKYYSV